MRTILNISVPKETAAEAKRVAREEGFASVSEFFRYLLREEKRRKLAEELNEQKRTYSKKTWTRMSSLKEFCD